MSQAMAQESTAKLLPAFQRRPYNPYSENVRNRMDEINAEDAQQAAPPVEPSAQQQPVEPTVQQPVEPAAPQFTPIEQPVPDAGIYLQALEQERQKAAAESAEKDKVIASLLEQQKEYEALKQQIELQKAVSDDAFNNLSSVDADDAKAISNVVLNATNAALAPIYKELRESRARTEAQFAQNARSARAQQINEYNRRILAKHPDYFELMNTKEYRAFMGQRDGLSSKTRDQRCAEEFLAGNTDYVIDALNQLKGKKPSVEQLQNVAPVQVAPAAAAVDKSDGLLDLRDLNNLYQMGQLNYSEYVKKLRDWRASQSKE